MTVQTGRRRQAAKAETRRLILETAYELFESRGYEKTTMRALADRAHVGLGTIFQHFPTKDFLLVEAFETDVAAVIEHARSTLPPADIRAQLLHIARSLYEFYARRPKLSLRFIGAVYQAEGPAADKLGRQMMDFLAMIETLVEAARERGEVPSGLNPADAAMSFWSYYVNALVLWLWRPKPDFRTQLDQLSRQVDWLFLGTR